MQIKFGHIVYVLLYLVDDHIVISTEQPETKRNWPDVKEAANIIKKSISISVCSRQCIVYVLVSGWFFIIGVE